MANKYVKQEKYGLLLLVELVHVLSWSVTSPILILEPLALGEDALSHGQQGRSVYMYVSAVFLA